MYKYFPHDIEISCFNYVPGIRNIARYFLSVVKIFYEFVLNSCIYDTKVKKCR